MIQIMLFAPPAAMLLVYCCKSRPLLQNVLVALYALIHLCCSLRLIYAPENFTAFFAADPLNVLFLTVLSLVLLAVALYDFAFFRMADAADRSRAWTYNIFLLLFAETMNGVLLSSHLGMLWVFLEASTLVSAVLIYFHRTKSAIEATWKYLFICSIGISVAFIGIILLTVSCIGHCDSLFFTALSDKAEQLNPFWLKLSIPFLLVGFGTKMGLAPMHNWLPDAHSEAPAPISAMLSAALLNSAFIGILRVLKIFDEAGKSEYSSTLLLVMGFFSLFVTAVFILRSTNYKRMLAYSSVENMGILAIGAGLGGLGMFAALLHMAAHSLIKCAFFLVSGNIYALTHSKEIKDAHSLLQRDWRTGWLWMGCFLGISAFPPFVTFLSEFIIIREMFVKADFFQMVLFFVLLTVILFGIGKTVIFMLSPEKNEAVAAPEKVPMKLPSPCLLVPALLLALAVGLGIRVPRAVVELIAGAVQFIGE